MFDAKTNIPSLGLDFAVDWKAIAQLALFNVQRHFARQEGPGGAWAPLKPATIARKIGPRPLFETGDLYKSYQRQWTKYQAEVYSSGTSYAKFHDYGTVKMPQRRFLWLDDMTVGYIEERVADGIEWSRA